MPALNFKKQFAPAVESWEKLQTIRARRKDGRDPKAGQTLYLYTGMRTKVCRKLGETTCKEVIPITIESDLYTIIGTKSLDTHDEVALAKADGFDDLSGFYDFFDKTHGLPFHGLLIKWDRPHGATERNTPCGNTRCKEYCESDPDGTNCLLFCPANEKKCDRYRPQAEKEG